MASGPDGRAVYVCNDPLASGAQMADEALDRSEDTVMDSAAFRPLPEWAERGAGTGRLTGRLSRPAQHRRGGGEVVGEAFAGAPFEPG